MGGVVGIYGFSNLWKMARFVYYSLLALQHRGQETSGITTFDGKSLTTHKSQGFVDQVFSDPKTLENLQGWVGIGNVTSIPEADPSKIEPLVVSNPVKVALCYDGKILNWRELRKREKLNAVNGGTLFAMLLSRELEKNHPVEAMTNVMGLVRGVYCAVALTERGEMIAARDPYGVKPLAIGSFGFDYGVVASESCAMDVIGADFKSDVNPGEIYVFEAHSIERKQAFKPKPKFCAFEYVYLARPDSLVNGKSVYEVRMKIGEKLAEEHSVNRADVVLGVPETAIPFAMAYSHVTKTPMGIGFIQTGRRIRSAIKPTQFERMVGVQLKLNPVKVAMAGKRSVLIDDSVVRGNTTKNTVNLMRNKMGAKEIHVRVGSPRLLSPCPYGTEVPPKDELIAVHLNADEVSKVVGADTFHWLSLKGLTGSIGMVKRNLCLGCFTSRYPAGEGE